MLRIPTSLAAAAAILGCATTAMAARPAATAVGTAPIAAAQNSSTTIEDALQAPSLSCAIQSTQVTGGLRLAAVVTSSDAISGAYKLTIIKAGPSGSSDISRDGEFTGAAGRTTIFSRSEFSLERGSALSAKLMLKTSTGHTSCNADFGA